jgi:hypothetical protein
MEIIGKVYREIFIRTYEENPNKVILSIVVTIRTVITIIADISNMDNFSYVLLIT